MDSLYDKSIHHSFVHLPQFKELVNVLNHSSITTSNLSTVLSNYNDNNNRFQFDFIIENQRGMKFFGIPLFSNNSLIPLIDPSNYQALNGSNIILSYNNLMNYPLPDLDWEWTWPNWYILMFDDVDDQGWIYSSVFFHNRQWKGKYYFGNFIRRRVWIRMRHKIESKDSFRIAKRHVIGGISMMGETIR